MYCTRYHAKKCSSRLFVERASQVIYFLFSQVSRISAKKLPFSIKDRPFCIDSVIVTPLIVLLDHLAIHRTAAVFLFFLYFGPNVHEGNSIPRKPARLGDSSAMIRKIGRRMRRSLFLSTMVPCQAKLPGR